MADRQHSLRKEVVIRGVILGAIGGAAGYLGPLIIVPDAAQGPLLGIVFTGPLGFLLGVILGLLFSKFELRPRLRETIFGLVAILVAAGVLYSIHPGDSLSSFLVDVEILACEPPSVRTAAAADRWADAARRNPRLEQRAGWREEITALIRRDSGVTLTGRVRRRRSIYRPAKREARLQWKLGPWLPKEYDDTYFARYGGASCGNYPVGSRGVYWIHVEEAEEFPPEKLSAFLSLYVIDRVPHELEAFAR